MSEANVNNEKIAFKILNRKLENKLALYGLTSAIISLNFFIESSQFVIEQIYPSIVGR
jgi:hypothetical protein